MTIYWIAAALLGFAFWLGWTYNHLVRARNLVRNGWGDVDVQLQRRHDLVPMLVDTVKAYASHERHLLEAVTALRSDALRQTAPASLALLERELERQLVQLIALREAYPDLKANQNFLKLQQELVEIEEHLQYARRFYNGAVRQLNDDVGVFPALMVAGAMGFAPAEYFQADSRESPRIGTMR